MVLRRARGDDDQLSDEALVAGMASGDDRSAVIFVRRYQRRAYGLAYTLIGDSAIAEEVAQEALVRVWRHAQVFDARRGAVAPWVLTITRNLAIDALRLRRAIPIEPDDLVGLLGSDPHAEQALESSELGPDVRRLLKTLPVDQRRALVLAALYGFTAAEVATRESIPLGTAKSRIRAGMRKLQAELAAFGSLR